MSRVVFRLFGVVALGLAGAAVASACASDQGGVFDTHQKLDASAGGGCDPMYCPMINTQMGGHPCCIFNTCGVDYGSGCTPIKRDGG